VPPRVGSRYAGSRGLRDERGRLYLTERQPFGYRDYPDNRTHVVRQGDTLFGLAGRYFATLGRGCGYWWAIADFQPVPIVDPTLELELGRQVIVPATRVLTDVILPRGARP
jgi:hypothetical protein